MAITAPTGEQLRFVSSKTGEHVLDTYLEAAEIGNRQLHDLLDDMFDASTGVFRSDNFQFRYDTSTDKIQVRVGQFANSNTSWTDVTTFFKITGTFSASTTYNNFDLLTLSNKDVYIVHGLSSGTTFADEAAVIASSNTSKIVDVSEAKDWAIKTDGQVSSTDYSSKAWAIGGTGVTDTASKGAAKEWATKTSGTVDGTSYSAKYWATSTNVTTVASGISNINTVAGSISNVNTTAASIADVNTTAGSISNVNTVAAELGSGQDVTVVAADIANVTTVAGISSNVTTVAGISANVTTVAGISANVTTVAGNNTDVSTVASNVADIQTVADEIDNNKLQTVANNINAVVTAADDLNEATSEIDTVATNIANVNAVGTNIANVNTLAGISSAVTTAAANTTAFNNLYLGAQSSAPTQDPDGSALDVGDLYFDTTSNTMKVRAASGWVNASSTVNGTANRFTFTATANQTTFTGADANNNTLAYDSGFMDVYMNGVKLAAADFTATNGTSVVITAAAAGDTLEMIAYGTFTLANIDINDLTNVNTTGVANHSILAYNSSNSRFEPTATPTFSSITVSGNVDGRDVSADGTKLDTVETNADVTDATNVTAAGALMDSELTSIASVKALNQGLATTDEPSFDNTTLNALAATISDTAVDVFVYDTSQDSDGGAWRKRTQHTSWYNETLNTATRGSRKEFPAVAVIVAESNQVTIYDGDDPDLPMWMVFNGTYVSATVSNITTAGGGTPFKAVTALSGRVCVANGGPNGIEIIKLLEDTAAYFTATANKFYGGNIAERNAGKGYAAGSLVDGETLVNSTVNDVAMTVLPNAPIDAATGLPRVTTAVATDGGVSVIKDDGTVVDITRSTSPMDGVQFDSGYLIFGSSSVGGVWYYDYIPASDEAATPNDGHIEYYDSGFANKATPAYLGYINTKSAGSYIGTTGNNDSGLTAVDFNNTDYTKSSTAFITSSYNTGWQNGDIKLATLSDTSTTNVTGAELVTNGTMESNSGWGALGSPVSQNQSNEQAHSGTYSWKFVTSGNYQGIKSASDMSVVSGKTYVINSWVYPVNDTGIAVRFGGVLQVVTGLTQGAWNEVTVTVTATSTSSTSYVQFDTNVNFGGGTWYIDDVSVRLAEEDRSVNDNGLQVFGTVTKSAVATGADLVGYSGWSSNGNYLSQPYNSDYDFTGDFCVSGWFKSASSSDPFICRLRNSSSAGSGFLISTGSNSTLTFAIYTQGFQASGRTTISTTTTHTNSYWQQIFAIRRNGVMELYIDGELIGSVVQGNTSLADTSGQPPLLFGQNYNYDSHFGGYLALWRISATSPSPEQIKKIYEDEKHLFTEGSQATLYGSSDAVTALAHDDTTDLLHVGTSAGRSVFQGLRRVDNTTDAVGAAISASNGLVAED